MEAVEWAGDRHQLGALGFEGLPDRAVGQLGMLVRFGVGDASVEQPGIQLLVACHPQPRREETLAHQPDLVLDLALLPAGCRRAGGRLDQIMAAHAQKAAVVLAILADEHGFDRRLHVVIDPAGARPLKKAKAQIYAWKKQLLDGAAGVFGSGGTEDTASEARVDLLYRQIGQLKVENDFLSRKLGK